jgi:hypothetical protein
VISTDRRRSYLTLPFRSSIRLRLFAGCTTVVLHHCGINCALTHHTISTSHEASVSTVSRWPAASHSTRQCTWPASTASMHSWRITDHCPHIPTACCTTDMPAVVQQAIQWARRQWAPTQHPAHHHQLTAGCSSISTNPKKTGSLIDHSALRPDTHASPADDGIYYAIRDLNWEPLLHVTACAHSKFNLLHRAGYGYAGQSGLTSCSTSLHYGDWMPSALRHMRQLHCCNCCICLKLAMLPLAPFTIGHHYDR